MTVSEVKKVLPFVYWADCEDPDHSSMCWNRGDALTQINDHGGTLHELSHTSELIAAEQRNVILESLLNEVTPELDDFITGDLLRRLKKALAKPAESGASE